MGVSSLTLFLLKQYSVIPIERLQLHLTAIHMAPFLLFEMQIHA